MATESISMHPSLAVEVRDLRVSFDNTPVLRGVNMRVPQGQIVALIGPNGSGKTTLLRCLLGLQKFSEGEIKIFGERDVRKVLPRIGYVPQRLALERSFILSVREFLSLRLRETRHWIFHSHKQLDAIIRPALAQIGVEPLLDQIGRASCR